LCFVLLRSFKELPSFFSFHSLKLWNRFRLSRLRAVHLDVLFCPVPFDPPGVFYPFVLPQFYRAFLGSSSFRVTERACGGPRFCCHPKETALLHRPLGHCLHPSDPLPQDVLVSRRSDLRPDLSFLWWLVMHWTHSFFPPARARFMTSFFVHLPLSVFPLKISSLHPFPPFSFFVVIWAASFRFSEVPRALF